MEKINISNSLIEVTNSYLNLLSKYKNATDSLSENLNKLYSICIYSEIKEIIDIKYDQNTDWKKFLIISKNESGEISRSMILNSISFNVKNNEPEINLTNIHGQSFNIKNYSLFLACTQTKNIFLNSKNLELLKNYLPIRKLFSNQNTLIEWPRKENLRNQILNYIALGLPETDIFNEKEINEYLSFYYHDYALLRRYLIDLKYLNRNQDGSKYFRQSV
ncbi:DUF2087 domain-containing protein [Leptospira congkakensis]|uniref:DUF2087 domain-containing protein n=1 Tax=Leptospira congkakensis TaxID=2484932 RepID=A0A4Z1A5Z9_9LEPT|nr:DUF2087 domain-containing protein [Leptospira congkakensis]TGL89516.1 DUF2087 domain-containing protein [Leptospira congkakensis]TGL95141.1 DUF2087 domain-containing protein [Leptospira congkakensis]TGL97871.1 DUF2087 domain-containing protein [Leptospira congkakensis]